LRMNLCRGKHHAFANFFNGLIALKENQVRGSLLHMV